MDEEAFERRLQAWERSRHPSAPIWIVEYARYWKQRAEAAERKLEAIRDTEWPSGFSISGANDMKRIAREHLENIDEE